jgi:hypothetical protein
MLKATSPTQKKKDLGGCKIGWEIDFGKHYLLLASYPCFVDPRNVAASHCIELSWCHCGCCYLPIPLVIGTLAAPQCNYYNYNIQNPTTTTTTTTYKSN